MTVKLAKILIDARLAAGLSQANVASALGISQQAVASWERGETGPRRKYLVKLAEILRISPVKLDPVAFGKIQGSVQKIDLGLELNPISLLSSQDVPHVTKSSDMNVELGSITSEKLYVSVEFSKCFAVIVDTDEMAPEYHIGDICIVDPNIRPDTGDDVLVTAAGQKSMLRRVNVRGQDPTGFVVMDLTTPNLNIPTITVVKGSGYLIQGTIVEHRRRRKSSAIPPPRILTS